MSDKEFKEWLNRNFSQAPAAAANEFQKISARMNREKKNLDKLDATSLLFCLASIVLLISVINLSKNYDVSSTASLNTKNDLLNSDEDLYRDFDVSLEHLDKILNSSRQM
jgi:hypothetical protein